MKVFHQKVLVALLFQVCTTSAFQPFVNKVSTPATSWVSSTTSNYIPTNSITSRSNFLKLTQLFSTNSDTKSNAIKKRVVIIGAGWAGYTAASTLAENSNDLEIILLDGAPKGKGGLAGGWRTPSGRPVEAGIHGFWREYQNTFDVMENIEGVEIENVLTEYTPSALVSQNGRVALAPVLGEATQSTNQDSNPFLSTIAKLLPPPLDLALLTIPSPSSPLTNLDRISALNLLPSWADFQQQDRQSWLRYDKISAQELFLEKAQITPALYEELVSPLLHVLPMGPGYDISAAAALSCFHVFALQSNGAFDVRWCRGSIAEKIFGPWSQQLEKQGVQIRGGVENRVLSMERRKNATDYNFEIQLQEGKMLQCDSVIMAVGATAMGKLSDSSPSVFDRIPISKSFSKLRGITCVAVRLYLTPSPITQVKGGQHTTTEMPSNYATKMKDSPVIVCGENILPELEETGFCIYDLQRLQDEFSTEKKFGCAVLEMDFFRADAIVDKTDEEILQLSLLALSKALQEPLLSSDMIIDSSVVRARNAVSHFCLDSASNSPDITMDKNLHVCGDWIDRTGHASWSTEKSVVTGRQAANAALQEMGIAKQTKVLEVVEDTDALKGLRNVAKQLRRTVPPKNEGVPLSPWAFLQNMKQ